MKNMAPKLSKIKKENPFKVPDHYFDNFSARLQASIEAEKTTGTAKQNTIIRYLKPAIGLAAGFALIFSLAYWPMKLLTPNELAKNEVKENTTEMLYASIVESIDENSFYNLLEETISAASLNDEEMEDYMKANSTDFELYSEVKGNN